ncbi:MAG: hypothetical protein LBV79_06125 [Candidatus Adiutrix sp.]|jgi:hypothetical protein|nr:hypothetical protein [Candidatus Adiutrix sp.]
MTFAKKTMAAAFALLLCVTAFAVAAEAQEAERFTDVVERDGGYGFPEHEGKMFIFAGGGSKSEQNSDIYTIDDYAGPYFSLKEAKKNGATSAFMQCLGYGGYEGEVEITAATKNFNEGMPELAIDETSTCKRLTQSYGSFDDVLAEYSSMDMDGDDQPDPDAHSYALHDLDANGADELLVSGPGGSTYIYTSASGKAYLAGEFWPRNRLLSIEDGNWYTTGSGGAANTAYDVQRLSDDGAYLVTIERWASDLDDDNAMFYTHTLEGEEERISEDEYKSASERFDAMPDAFPESLNLNWQPVSASL